MMLLISTKDVTTNKSLQRMQAMSQSKEEMYPGTASMRTLPETRQGVLGLTTRAAHPRSDAKHYQEVYGEHERPCSDNDYHCVEACTRNDYPRAKTSYGVVSEHSLESSDSQECFCDKLKRLGFTIELRGWQLHLRCW